MTKRSRLHSPDARLLRDLFMQIMERVIELEYQVGAIQKALDGWDRQDAETVEVRENVEMEHSGR